MKGDVVLALRPRPPGKADCNSGREKDAKEMFVGGLFDETVSDTQFPNDGTRYMKMKTAASRA